jgi:hypothetical protein
VTLRLLDEKMLLSRPRPHRPHRQNRLCHPAPRRATAPHRHRLNPRPHPRPDPGPRPQHHNHRRRHRRTHPPANTGPHQGLPTHRRTQRPQTEKSPEPNAGSELFRCLETSQSRGGGIRTHDLFVPNADSMYQDWSASAIELHRCDRQWCRVPRRIDLSAASLLPIDLLIRRHGRMV